MIVAITGGTGFIGSQLVFRHVSAGDTVRVLSRRMREDIDLPNEARVYGGDLTNPADDFRNFVEGADDTLANREVLLNLAPHLAGAYPKYRVYTGA